jgi:hypothetical protein
MRVTTNSSSLIDVMIRNKIFYHSTSKVVELGYSDHFAHVMNIALGSFRENCTKSLLKKKYRNI